MISRSYRALFTRLRLETLEHYEPSSTLGMKLKRFVHAEVQMVVFLETSSPPPWPRVIGASKEACFLCDSFIKAHGYFYLSKAHRKVFHQWTVPDRKDYPFGGQMVAFLLGNGTGHPRDYMTNLFTKFLGI